MVDAVDPAVVLFIYNRPALTARIFSAIREARPSRLYVFADGPRADRPDDLARTLAAREATVGVDWHCDVQREYAPENLGIKRRVDSGMSRVFDEVETAIILEDDCLPNPGFFPFCRELLVRYRHDARVMSVCGSRLTPVRPIDESYNFSRYPFLWGWATWRRAWRRYDGTMQQWPRRSQTSWLDAELRDRHAVAYWTYFFDRNREAAEAGDWDTAWMFSSWVHGGLSIIPAANMVSNLGWHAEGTHTKDPRSLFSALPSFPMGFPLSHPREVAAADEEERLAESVVFGGNLGRMLGSLRRRIHGGR